MMETSLPKSTTFIAACVFAVAAGACAAQTAPTRTNDEPILFPKIDAGRVTARVNDKVDAAAQNARIETSRINGNVIVRVTPENAPSYVLSNQQPNAVQLRRDQEALRVPLWQIGSF